MLKHFGWGVLFLPLFCTPVQAEIVDTDIEHDPSCGLSQKREITPSSVYCAEPDIPDPTQEDEEFYTESISEISLDKWYKKDIFSSCYQGSREACRELEQTRNRESDLTPTPNSVETFNEEFDNDLEY